MNTIEIKGHTYRIAKLNAIETLAFQYLIDFKSFKSIMKLFGTILEKIEVQCNDKWLPVKLADKEVYLPSDIENDFETINKLVKFFQDEVLKPVFLSSNESKE